MAKEDGRVVGAIRLSAHEVAPTSSVAARRSVFVQELVVARRQHRCGIGRTLMERARRWAEEQGSAATERNGFEFNRGALAFYAALGYRSVQRRVCLRWR